MNGPLLEEPLGVALSAVDGGLDEGGGEPEVGCRGLPEGVHLEGPGAQFNRNFEFWAQNWVKKGQVLAKFSTRAIQV